MMTKNEKEIANRLVERGWENHKEEGKFLGGNGSCYNLVNDLDKYPHAFVIGCIVDRRITAKIAWAFPHRMEESIGSFCFEEVYRRRRALANYTSQHHVLGKNIGKCVRRAIEIIHHDYGGNASRIWSNEPSSAAVVYRFLQFPGVGPKISTMAVNILARTFKIRFSDYYSVDISADVHVKRVFCRLGLVQQPSVEQIVYRARELNPEFPGILDGPCWNIGRTWCAAREPKCNQCYMNDICPSAPNYLS